MIAGVPIAEVMRISPVFDILMGCSAIMIAVAAERFWTYHFLSMRMSAFMERIRPLIAKGQYNEVVKICEEEDKPIANMIKVGLANISKGTKNISKLMEGVRASERMGLERLLFILGTLGNSAPFIGLLGTVIGIIRSFKLLEETGSAGPSAIMVGIAEALVTTAVGLLVAVPAVILFNTFQERVKNFSIQMEVASKEVMALIRGRSK